MVRPIGIDARWADAEFPEFGEPVIPELVWARIKAIGTPRFAREIECVALAIEYVPEQSSHAKCLVLASDGSRIWALSSDQIALANEDESPE